MKKNLLIIISMLFLLFMFLGSPKNLTTRSLINGWDIGHIIIFIFWTILLLQFVRKFRYRYSVLLLAALVFIGINLVGVLIEVFQGFIGRSNDFEDIIKNITGSLLAISFSPELKRKMYKRIRFFLQTVAVLLCLVEMIPFTRSVIDETVCRYQFPVLANFETPFETDRWGSYSKIERSDSMVSQGRYSLKVYLTTQQYSGVSLHYFPGNWFGFKSLKMDIYNPESQTLTLIIRIHDTMHRLRNQPYRDRFNKRLEITPGWNKVLIDLNQVRFAPAEREMDMSDIVNMRLFVGKLEKPMVFYLDNVRLVP